MLKKYDYASVISTLFLAVSLLIPDFIHFKETRISMAEAMAARESLSQYFFIYCLLVVILFLFCILKKKQPIMNFLVGIYTDFLIVFLIYAVAVSVRELNQGRGGRFSFGVGFIIALFALYSVLLKCEEYIKNKWMKMLVAVFAWILVGAMLIHGTLDSYSVMQEYIAQKSQFFSNLLAHIQLSFSALMVAVIVGIPVGYFCYKDVRVDKITISGLSIVETMPQLALFAIIRIPFIYLSNTFPLLKENGFGGYGFAPAFTALFLYGLYLVIHNVRAAFHIVDDKLVENAYAMGMTSRNVFWKVQIPSAMPYILNGVRIAMISTIVGASLSSFVGAAGLGVYIVNGVNALAIDLQLLGIIPIFVITIVSDLIMGKLIRLLLPKGVEER